MVQVLDCRHPQWSERLHQILLLGLPSALVLSGYSMLPKLQKQGLRQQILQYGAETAQITALDHDLLELKTGLPMEQWPLLDTLPHLAHLMIVAPASTLTVLSPLQRLIQIVAQLRAPDGCPWDRVQTPESLIPYVIEEAYETVAAIRSGDPDKIADELGDLLLQVVLQSQIFTERQAFDLGTVARSIGDKLIRRHPHVFGPEPDAGVEGEALHQQWEQIKQAETPDQSLGDKVLHYSESLPPLMAALKISKRVARAGFEWPEIEGIWAKVAEEEQELREVLETPIAERSEAEIAEIRQRQGAELGDLLFTLVNLGRWYGIDPAAALQETNRRFARRIQAMEAGVEGQDLSGRSLAELEGLWQQAKRQFP